MNDKVVYLHIRKDTNSIFYIGMGSVRRSKSKNGRNNLWNKIVNKAGFYVCLFKENLTSKSAKELEIKLIKYYKSIGVFLCNFTDGGDGRLGSKQPQSFVENHRKFMIGNSFGLGKPAREPIIGKNLNDGSIVQFLGRKSIENDGRFSARQVYRCASRDKICKSTSIGIHKNFQFFWESEFQRKVG